MLDAVIGGVIGAAVVAAAAAVGGWIYRRHLLVRVQGIRTIYGDTLAVYDKAEQALKDIEDEALRSPFIRYVGDYNETFVPAVEPTQNLLYRVIQARRSDIHVRKGGFHQGFSVQFLLMSPSAESKFLPIRSQELGYPPQAVRRAIHFAVQTIKTTLLMLDVPEETVEVKYHKFNLVFRLVLFQDSAFVSFYRAGRHGGDGPHVRVAAGSELYNGVARYFETIWHNFSDPVTQDVVSG